MTRPVTAEQVLTDIELALLQGSIPRGDLGASIQSIKKFANATRGELLDPQRQKADYAALATRIFQLDDMLLALLHEIARQLAAQEVELRRSVAYLAAGAPAQSTMMPQDEHKESRAAGTVPPPVIPAPTDDSDWSANIAEIEGAMALDTLQLELALHDEGKGALADATRPLRGSFHSLVVYYVNQLADRQAAINRLYGDRLLALHEENRSQSAVIANLEQRLAILEADRSQQQAR